MTVSAPGYDATHAGLRSAPLLQGTLPGKPHRATSSLDNMRTNREHRPRTAVFFSDSERTESRTVTRKSEGKTPMLLTVLATVPFLAALAVALLALEATIGGNRTRIIAALRGELPKAYPVLRPVTVRFTPRPVKVQPLRAEPRWRAAA
jgi:hypothetical protein